MSRETHRFVRTRGHVQAPRDGEALHGCQEGHEGGCGQVREGRAAVQDRAVPLIVCPLRQTIMSAPLFLSGCNALTKEQTSALPHCGHMPEDWRQM